MIKKLLLAGALALTFLSESFAQVDKVVDSSFFTSGDINVVGTDGVVYATPPTLDANNNVVISVNQPAGSYTSFVYQVYSQALANNTTFPFPITRPRTVKLMVSANPATTIRVGVQDVNGVTTDANVPTINVGTTLSEQTAVFAPGSFVSEYATGCKVAPYCLVDSTQIANIQFIVNPAGANAYTGTVTIAWVYAGDSLASEVVLASPSQNTNVVAGSAFALLASSTGSPDSVAFFDNKVRLGSATTAPYSLNWASVPSGINSITAVAYTGLLSDTSAANTITGVPVPTITGLPPVGPNGYTVDTDSGYYSRGDISVFGGTGAGDYATPVQDINGNVVINVTKGADYTPLTFDFATPIHLPKHAMQFTISIAASSPVVIRFALEDGNSLITDGLGNSTIDVAAGAVPYAPTLITIPLTAAGALNDTYSGCATGPTVPCLVDTSNLIQFQLLPTGGNSAYTGTIVIGYVYVGDTTTVQQITGVTAAAATAATSVFPNPAAGIANYSVAVSGAVTATLADMTGKVVSVQNGTSGFFDVSGLNKGVYVVSFALNGAYYTSQKLVVSGN